MTTAEKEFVIFHAFKHISSVEEKVFRCSPIEDQFGISWKIYAQRKTDHFGLYVHCEPEKKDKEWSIEIWREMKISGADGRSFSKNAEVDFKSTANQTAWGWNEFIKWEDLMKEYVVNDTLEVELHVKIKKMSGIVLKEKKNLMSFDASNRKFSDVVLIVKNRRFYVSKLYLAFHSTYFETRFLEESNTSEITLEDVNAADFQNFLELLHLESPIDESTIDGITHLANMYEAKLAIRKCEQFLIEDSKKSLKEKLQLAHRYNLKELQDFCLSKITTLNDIRSVLADNLNDMDPSVLGALLQKSLAR